MKIKAGIWCRRNHCLKQYNRRGKNIEGAKCARLFQLTRNNLRYISGLCVAIPFYLTYYFKIDLLEQFQYLKKKFGYYFNLGQREPRILERQLGAVECTLVLHTPSRQRRLHYSNPGSSLDNRLQVSVHKLYSVFTYNQGNPLHVRGG